MADLVADSPLRPILDRILVRRLPPEKKGDSFDDLVPDKYRQHNNLGRVIAIGDGILLGQEWHPLTEFVQLGQVVLYGEYTAERLEDSGEDELYIIRLQDVRGVKRD